MNIEGKVVTYKSGQFCKRGGGGRLLDVDIFLTHPNLGRLRVRRRPILDRRRRDRMLHGRLRPHGGDRRSPVQDAREHPDQHPLCFWRYRLWTGSLLYP